ncbi:MAG: hypothetical protein JO142_09245 [Burkholderiales bacterium]|nr:hypothetical protein [Burkholderiales bacterium]
MLDQRGSRRRLVRWKAAVIPLNKPDKVIQGFATEIAQRGVTMFCAEQLSTVSQYRIVFRVPDVMFLDVSYVEIQGQPIYSSLVGSTGQFRTGIKLIGENKDYRDKLDQLLRTMA